MSKKRSSRPTESSQFKQAVKEIPTLIVKEKKRETSITTEETKSVTPEAEVHSRTSRAVYHSPQHSRKWMFIGVIGCSVFILTFWVLYISNLFSVYKNKLNPTQSFVESGQDDFSMVATTFANIEKKFQNAFTDSSEIKTKVTDALRPLMATGTASSTAQSTSSTPESNTVTTTLDN